MTREEKLLSTRGAELITIADKLGIKVACNKERTQLKVAKGIVIKKIFEAEKELEEQKKKTEKKEKKKTSVKRKKYIYGMRLRPFDIGCQPMDGLIDHKESDKEETGYWYFLTYNRELSEEEIKGYKLDYIRPQKTSDEERKAKRAAYRKEYREANKERLAAARKARYEAKKNGTYTPKEVKQYEFNGKAQGLTEWSKELGISRKTLYRRIHKYGWDIEKAIATPKN